MVFFNNLNFNFKPIFLWFLLLIFSKGLFCQNGEVIINMDTTLVKLIEIKKEVNSEIENFKIQIFNGSRNEAENTISEYKILYNDSSAIIKYEAPNYKIWILYFSISEFNSFFNSINFVRVVSIFIITLPSWQNKFLLKISSKNHKKISLKSKF